MYFTLLTNGFFGVPLCKQVGIIETKLLRSTIVSLSHTLCGIMGFPKPPENVHQTDPYGWLLPTRWSMGGLKKNIDLLGS